MQRNLNYNRQPSRTRLPRKTLRVYSYRKKAERFFRSLPTILVSVQTFVYNSVLLTDLNSNSSKWYTKVCIDFSHAEKIGCSNFYAKITLCLRQSIQLGNKDCTWIAFAQHEQDLRYAIYSLYIVIIFL